MRDYFQGSQVVKMSRPDVTSIPPRYKILPAIYYLTVSTETILNDYCTLTQRSKIFAMQSALHSIVGPKKITPSNLDGRVAVVLGGALGIGYTSFLSLLYLLISFMDQN